jgi:hypothetical protein
VAGSEPTGKGEKPRGMKERGYRREAGTSGGGLGLVSVHGPAWPRYVPRKRRLTLSGLHGVISQKMVILFQCYVVQPNNFRNITANFNILQWLQEILRLNVPRDAVEFSEMKIYLLSLVEMNICCLQRVPMPSQHSLSRHLLHGALSSVSTVMCPLDLA